LFFIRTFHLFIVAPVRFANYVVRSVRC
jgi:hypothetical protein